MNISKNMMRIYAMAGMIMGAGLISSAVASDYYCIYNQYVQNGPNTVDMPCLPKEERLKSYAGDIFVYFDNDMPAELTTCVRVAADIWESYVRTSVPVRLKFEYASLDNEEQESRYTIVTSSNVRFVKENTTDKIYPSSLYKQLQGDESAEFDAVITINSDIPFENWNFTHSAETRCSRFDATTSFINAIGHALGVEENADNPSDPDSHVKVYSSNNMYQIVDNSRIEALEAKGWKTGKPEQGLYALGSASETGILTTNNFWMYNTAEAANLANFDIDVCYYKKDGATIDKKVELDKSDHNSTVRKMLVFDLPTEEETALLQLNVNGDIYGYADGTFVYQTDSEHPVREPIAVKYRLSIPQPPTFESHTFVKNPNMWAGHYILVTYFGADHILTRITDSDGNTTSDVINSPYIAPVIIPDYDSNKSYTIELLISNSKGVDTTTITIPSETDIAGVHDVTAGEAEWSRIEVYDVNGRFISDNADDLPKGIYIVVYYDDLRVVSRKKIIV